MDNKTKFKLPLTSQEISELYSDNYIEWFLGINRPNPFDMPSFEELIKSTNPKTKQI